MAEEKDNDLVAALIDAGMLDDGIHLSFIPRDAKVHLEAKHPKGRERSISMLMTLERGHTVRLSPERSLADAEWCLFLTEATSYNDEADKQQAIGYLSHHDAIHSWDINVEERCTVSAAIGPAMFNTLLATLQAGHLPTLIYARIRGITLYGWAPDGRDKEWDKGKYPTPAVLEVSFNIPLITPAQSEGDEQLASDLSPVTRSDIYALRSQLAIELAALRQESNKRWGFLLLLVFLVLVLLFFRH